MGAGAFLFGYSMAALMVVAAYSCVCYSCMHRLRTWRSAGVTGEEQLELQMGELKRTAEMYKLNARIPWEVLS